MLGLEKKKRVVIIDIQIYSNLHVTQVNYLFFKANCEEFIEVIILYPTIRIKYIEIKPIVIITLPNL